MADNPNSVAVLDFRRSGMVLNWHSLGGTWTACDVPPALVHGIALIRPDQPNVCVFAHGGSLRLQVGAEQYALAEDSPRISCSVKISSLGLRRRFTVESMSGGTLFSQGYWSGQGHDFFRWLAEHARDPAWRLSCGREWSEGVSAAALRA